MIKHMLKLDWTRRESVRAELRRAEDATLLVVRQAKLSTGNMV